MNKNATPIKLTSYQLVLLRTMSEDLFKSHSVDIVRKEGYIDEFVTLTVSNDKSGRTHIFHWFEFCTVHIPNILFTNPKRKREFVLSLLIPNNHPIDKLWHHYNALKKR